MVVQQNFIGLGYKVIKFHRLLSFDSVFQNTQYSPSYNYFEYSYICPWGTDIDEVYNMLEEKYILKGRL